MKDKAIARPTKTRVHPRQRARDWVAPIGMIYELSSGLHWAANCRADRFGPTRISPLQWGHR